MVDKYKGVIEIDISGALRGFKFGTRAMALFCEHQKISLKEVDALLRNDPSLDVVLDFYWCGAVAYSRINKLPDPSLDEVADWIDQYGLSKLDDDVSKAIENPNLQAPEAGQPT